MFSISNLFYKFSSIRPRFLYVSNPAMSDSSRSPSPAKHTWIPNRIAPTQTNLVASEEDTWQIPQDAIRGRCGLPVRHRSGFTNGSNAPGSFATSVSPANSSTPQSMPAVPYIMDDKSTSAHVQCCNGARAPPAPPHSLHFEQTHNNYDAIDNEEYQYFRPSTNDNRGAQICPVRSSRSSENQLRETSRMPMVATEQAERRHTLFYGNYDNTEECYHAYMNVNQRPGTPPQDLSHRSAAAASEQAESRTSNQILPPTIQATPFQQARQMTFIQRIVHMIQTWAYQ